MAAAWLPVAAYMALIFYLSSLPHPDEQLPKFLFETLGDKLLHAIEYAVLEALSYRAFRRAAGPHAARYAVVYAAAAASFYGVSDEVHQAFVPFRTATWLDWLADTAGGILGSLTAQRVMERRAKDAIS
jgi:VanZ family protein